ncbi:hypothetical protein PAL_GLEAN10000515 [Pteropus alecto]|uniref:Uncharacterized protein n=1 Tax=Pteropus alecto TaxID=9402 RepID=L5L397_PTEAL|nr:hypothetical protein PAL_GLEAN10000515 [Pteropus alecto]
MTSWYRYLCASSRSPHSSQEKYTTTSSKATVPCRREEREATGVTCSSLEDGGPGAPRSLSRTRTPSPHRGGSMGSGPHCPSAHPRSQKTWCCWLRSGIGPQGDSDPTSLTHPFAPVCSFRDSDSDCFVLSTLPYLITPAVTRTHVTVQDVSWGFSVETGWVWGPLTSAGPLNEDAAIRLSAVGTMALLVPSLSSWSPGKGNHHEAAARCLTPRRRHTQKRPSLDLHGLHAEGPLGADTLTEGLQHCEGRPGSFSEMPWPDCWGPACNRSCMRFKLSFPTPQRSRKLDDKYHCGCPTAC